AVFSARLPRAVVSISNASGTTQVPEPAAGRRAPLGDGCRASTMAATSAIDTGRQRRIEVEPALVYLLPADKAVPVIAFLDPLQRCVDPRQLFLPLACGRKRSRLLLEGMHSRKPPDRRLVQLHRATIGFRLLLGLQQLGAPCSQSLGVLVQIQFARHRRLLHMKGSWTGAHPEPWGWRHAAQPTAALQRR